MNECTTISLLTNVIMCIQINNVKQNEKYNFNNSRH